MAGHQTSLKKKKDRLFELLINRRISCFILDRLGSVLAAATRKSQKGPIFLIQDIFIHLYKNSEGKQVKSDHTHMISSMFGFS